MYSTMNSYWDKGTSLKFIEAAISLRVLSRGFR